MSNKPVVQAELASKQKLKSGSSGKAIASLVLGLASFFCAFFTGIIAIILGVLALGDISKSQGRLKGNGLAIAGIVLGAIGCFWTLIWIALLLPAVQQAREAARQTNSMNQIREMTLSLHNYEATNRQLPPAEAGSELSWRVQILPFIEEMDLYKQFHLDEPWDSPNNLALVDKMPAVFQNPNIVLAPGKTTYLIPTTLATDASNTHAAFVQGQPGVKLTDFKDGTSNTILILEADADAAVTWTDPDGDWMHDPNDPSRSLGHVRHGIILVGMADGSTRRIKNSISPQELNALITRDGGEKVDF